MTTLTPFNSRDPVNETKGGTAQSSYITGDTLYSSASNTLSKLAIGAANSVLTVSSGIPSWQPIGLPNGTNALNTYYLVEDFFGSETTQGSGGAYAISKGNNGTSSSSSPAGSITNPGIYALQTGTTTTGSANVYFGAVNVSTSSPQIVLGGGVTQLDFIANIPVLSNVTDRFTVRIGFLAYSAFPTYSDGCWFQYADNVNSGNWTINCRKSGTTTTANTSTAANTNWNRFTIIVNAAATSVAYYINDVQVANSPIATNIPTAALTWGVDIVKSAGTTSSTLNVDLCVLKIDLTSSR